MQCRRCNHDLETPIDSSWAYCSNCNAGFPFD